MFLNFFKDIKSYKVYKKKIIVVKKRLIIKNEKVSIPESKNEKIMDLL